MFQDDLDTIATTVKLLVKRHILELPTVIYTRRKLIKTEEQTFIAMIEGTFQKEATQERMT